MTDPFETDRRIADLHEALWRVLADKQLSVGEKIIEFNRVQNRISWLQSDGYARKSEALGVVADALVSPAVEG